MFTATFLYALVLTQNIENDFVPTLSLMTALLLLLASVAMLLALLYRLTETLRASAVIQEVGRRGRKVIESAYPEPFMDAALDRLPVEPSAAPIEVILYDRAARHIS